jgi:hypothetical protein
VKLTEKKITLHKMGWFSFGTSEVTENIESNTEKNSTNLGEIIIIAVVSTCAVLIIVKLFQKKCSKAIEKKVNSATLRREAENV